MRRREEDIERDGMSRKMRVQEYVKRNNSRVSQEKKRQDYRVRENKVRVSEEIKSLQKSRVT